MKVRADNYAGDCAADDDDDDDDDPVTSVSSASEIKLNVRLRFRASRFARFFNACMPIRSPAIDLAVTRAPAAAKIPDARNVQTNVQSGVSWQRMH